MELAIAVVGVTGLALALIVGYQQVSGARREVQGLKKTTMRDLEIHRAEILAEVQKNRDDMAQVIARMEGARESMLADLGRMLMLDGKLDEAVEMLSDLLEKDAENVEARWQRGQCYERQRTWSWALEDYQSVLSHPLPAGLSAGEAHLALGRVLHNLGRHAEACTPLKTAAEASIGQKAEVLNLLGESQRLSGELQSSLQSYEECLGLAQKSAVAAVGKARTLDNMAAMGLRTDWQEAVAWLEHRMDVHPEGRANYLEARAELHLRHGMTKEALSDLDASVYINPGNSRAYKTKGAILLGAAQASRLRSDGSETNKLAVAASEALERGLRISAQGYAPVLHNLRVQAYLLLDNAPEAEREGRLSRDGNPNYWQNQCALLMVLAWKQDWTKLIEESERALAVSQAVKSPIGHLWIRFYYLLALVVEEGLIPHTVKLCGDFLRELPHVFSAEFFEFWPVLKQHLCEVTTGPARVLVESIEDKNAAATFLAELEQKPQPS